MSVNPDALLPLTKGMAQAAGKDIYLLYSAAHADAALHDPTGDIDMPYHREEEEAVNEALANEDVRFEAMEDISRFVQSEFDGTDNDKLLTKAFDAVMAIVNARSMENPKPGEQKYRIREALDNYEVQHAAVSKEVESGGLPASVLSQLEQAHQTATVSRPPQSWVDIDRTRAASGWQL